MIARESESMALVRLSATLVGGAAGELRAAMQAAQEDFSDLEVEEALLQSYLFLGYPAALNAFTMWRDLCGGRPGSSRPDADPARWEERGEEVCRAVYGEQYGRLRAAVRSLHYDLEAWMVTEGYGKVLGRPGLALDQRELCIVAMLAVQGESVRRQLVSHLRGALNVGVHKGLVTQALEAALERANPETAAGARMIWQDVQQRYEARTPPGAPR